MSEDSDAEYNSVPQNDWESGSNSGSNSVPEATTRRRRKLNSNIIEYLIDFFFLVSFIVNVI